MKKKSTQKSIIPKGYTGKDYNKWQLELQKTMDQIRGTSLSARLQQ